MNPMTETQAYSLLRELFGEHGLEGWRISWSRAKKTAGTCDHRMKVITISTYLLAQRDYADSMMTITHEVAHALTKGHGHDRVWQGQHRALGGNGKRCFQHFDEKAPWMGECPHGKKYPRYRAPKRLDGWTCRCPGRGPVTWSRNAA